MTFLYAKGASITVSHPSLKGEKGTVVNPYVRNVYGTPKANVYTVKMLDGRMIDFEEGEIE